MVAVSVSQRGFHSSWLRLVIMALLTSLDKSMSESSNGICTRTELVRKTRLQPVYRTYIETFTDYYCRYTYRAYESCTKRRQTSRFVEEVQEYVDTENKLFCCPGYSETPCVFIDCSLKCNPVCEFDCLHSTCTAPNTCTCSPGYSIKRGTENICDPICSKPCVHGYCSEPETCTCDIDYILDSMNQYICKPVCTTPCVNADCVSPQVCDCHYGYNKVNDDPYKCHAHCDKPCHNAICTKPNVCTCLLGYKKDENDSSACSPVCSNDCMNGTCTGPDKCTCFDGFELAGDNYTCDPVCSSCVNAFCSSPEVCTCYPGYRVDDNDASICLPICLAACINANCTAPNTCECFEGYVETDNPFMCKPFCSYKCENGVCTDPEVCTCLWGFNSDNNTKNCSPSNSESHTCTFTSQLLGHVFDKSCFSLTNEFHLQLKDCQILTNLLLKRAQSDNNTMLINLNCSQVSNVSASQNSIFTELFCDIQLSYEYQSFSTQDLEDSFSSTPSRSISYTDRSYFFYDSSTRHYLSSIESSSTEIIHKSVTEPQLTGKSNSFQSEFVINYENNSKVLSKLSHLPLDLNITIQTLAMIRTRQITGGYFNHNETDLDQDWCVCHRNKTWRLCANSPIQLSLCTCKTPGLMVQLSAGDSTSLKAVTVKVIIVFLLSALVFLAFKKIKQFRKHYSSLIQ